MPGVDGRTDVRTLSDRHTIVAECSDGGCVQAGGTLASMANVEVKYFEVTVLALEGSVSVGLAHLY